jgi:hypothetical protein
MLMESILQSKDTDWQIVIKNCCLKEMYLIGKDKHRVKVKEWKMTFKQMEPPHQSGVSVSNKADFKSILVTKY